MEFHAIHLITAARQVKPRSRMIAPANPTEPHDLRRELAAAIDWWTTSGVDCDFADDVTAWLAPNAPDAGDPSPETATRRTKPPPANEQHIKKYGGSPGDWPDTLGAFHKWWCENELMDDAGPYPVIAPRGAAGAKIMIIVPEPEEHDETTLLSDMQGRLLDNILRAMEMPRDAVYFASALRRHTPLPDWAALKAAGVDDLLAHHVKLVGPDRIVAFGRNIPPLLGHDMAQGAPPSFAFGDKGTGIPVLAASSLPELLRSGPRRKRFWNNWLDWT